MMLLFVVLDETDHEVEGSVLFRGTMVALVHQLFDLGQRAFEHFPIIRLRWYDEIRGGLKLMNRQTTSRTKVTPPMGQPSANDSVDIATIELLASWRRLDATDDPEEIRAAEQELAEFKRAMNDSRALAGEPIIYP